MNFKQWILSEMAFSEMAFTSKMPIMMDKYDIAFLQQIPDTFWMQALEARYGKMLLDAVGPDGELVPGWNDTQVMTFNRNSKVLPAYKVNTYISQLVKKLKSLRYEIKQKDMNSMTALYYSPMSRGKAMDIVTTAKRYPLGPERKFVTTDGRMMVKKNPELPVGFAKFIPNRFEQPRNDYDPHEKSLENEKWIPLKPEVEKEAASIMKSALESLGRPQHGFHINWHYWNKPANRKQLLNGAVERVRLNLKDPQMSTPVGRKTLMYKYITSAFQRGLISRVNITKLINNGQNPNHMLYQQNPDTGMNYTPKELSNLAVSRHNYKSIDDRRSGI